MGGSDRRPTTTLSLSDSELAVDLPVCTTAVTPRPRAPSVVPAGRCSFVTCTKAKARHTALRRRSQRRLGLPEQLRLPSAILHRQLQQAHLRLLTPSPVQHCCRQCEGAPLASAIQIDVRVDGTFVPSSTVVGWVGPSPLAFNGIVSSQTTEPPRNHSSSTARVEVKSILCWFPCSHDVTFPSRLPLNSFS